MEQHFGVTETGTRIHRAEPPDDLDHPFRQGCDPRFVLDWVARKPDAMLGRNYDPCLRCFPELRIRRKRYKYESFRVPEKVEAPPRMKAWPIDERVEQAEWAEVVIEYLDEEIFAVDLLDALASAGLRLAQDTVGITSLAYQAVAAGTLPELPEPLEVRIVEETDSGTSSAATYSEIELAEKGTDE